MADDIVQVIQDAREDAISLSQFMYYPASTMVERRLAPSIHTLNYYLDYLHGLELIYSQEGGTITVNGEEVKTVRQAINDSVDSAILGEYQTQIGEDVSFLSSLSGIVAGDDVLSGVVQNTLSVATAKSLVIKDYVTSIKTQKFSDVDKGGAKYSRSTRNITSDYPSQAWFQSSDGAYWLLDSDFITPEMFGAVADGVTDDLQAFYDAVETASKLGKVVILPSKNYRMSTTFEIKYPITILGLNKTNKVTLDISNTEEGFFITSPDVTLENFTISANASNSIINGSGHKGTCITMSYWFVSPDLPEPPLVKNITVRDMVLTRQSGSSGAHAIAIMARTSHVLIENCDIDGADVAGSTVKHSNGILTHWGGHQHGVTAYAANLSITSGTILAGDTFTTSRGTTGYIIDQDVTSSTVTKAYIKELHGNLVSGDTLVTARGSTATLTSDTLLESRQARFEPNRYSYHPNNIRINNCRIRNTRRLIACSASYSVDVSNIDYYGDVAGGQLIDLPIGDEGATFAHPDDYGRVYDGFSFRNIRAKNITGSGANAVTVIDASGFCTSKQSDAALAAYASAPYTTEPYAGVAQPRRRLFEWKNVVIDNVTYDAGKTTPPSATPYVQTMYLRNLHGNFTFSNIYAVARGDILTLSMSNCVGNYTFNDCTFYGGVKLESVENVHLKNTYITSSNDLASDYCLDITGRYSTFTNSTTLKANSTTIPLTTPMSSTRVLVGQQIRVGGHTVYCSEYYESGDTVLKVTPLPVTVIAGSTFTIDKRSRNVTLQDCTLDSGYRGLRVGYANVTMYGGTIKNTGRYAVELTAECDVRFQRVRFSNSGLSRITEPALESRIIQCNSTCSLTCTDSSFTDNAYVNRAIVWTSTSTSVNLQDNKFIDAPVLEHFNGAIITGSTPVVWSNNRGSTGSVIELYAKRGTSSTGSWVKHDNGVLECWVRNLPITDAAFTWNFPASFLNTADISVTGMSGSPTSTRIVAGYATTVHTASIGIRDSDGANISSSANLHAIGFWK